MRQVGTLVPALDCPPVASVGKNTTSFNLCIWVLITHGPAFT